MARILIPASLAICWSLFQLYTAGFAAFPANVQRAIHVSFALALTFSLFPLTRDNKKITWQILDYITIILPLVIGGYVVYHADRISSRIWHVDPVEGFDFWFGLLFILLVLEASRRAVGKVITLLAVIFIGYAYVGPYLSGLISHRGVNSEGLVDLLFLSPDGIFGVPIGVSAEYVFYFVLFGAFLEKSGGGQLFIDIAYRLTRHLKGGSAKAAIVSSALMGSVNGSAVGNVVSTGIFTIPLMKKTGYSKRDSAAIEALASTGGQIMPPIMGAAAFLMAEMIGIPYAEIILAALIPALLYFLSLLVIVHLKAKKDNLNANNENIKQQQDKILKRIHLLLPLVILVTLIFLGYTLSTAAFWAIVSIVAVSYFRKDTCMGINKIASAMEDGAKQAVKVAIPCAVAGIIVGVISLSGLGLKFTDLIVQWSFGNLILAMILIAIGCIILGMGMPTTSAYIMGAILLTPALVQFEVERLAAHMFVLYFAVLSMITPPIALASYSAASISGAKMGETSIRALLFGLAFFLIPFSFVFNPSLLLIGEISEIIWTIFSTTLGIVALSVCIIGYLFANISWLMRSCMCAAAILMIVPYITFDIIGITLFLVLVIIHWLRIKYFLKNEPTGRSFPKMIERKIISKYLNLR
ncbi:TRAP transporter 4TM/12TM fusion protein [Caldalkalibacillus uzonensis]|uniref:TRAP transporter 4TM/12TM fusion protein n=1 Tax=Caldalkalibacillus uzonensis TaxID=353224 RepID=A0ABU0CXY3_9BACI|nr:TRAP transporter permease [Caldalkalibacillus uzonensis]MDQ0341018.1 TRAP transporter 4TM/12TM fusion protein [Caldalkalibacillus uzonensis]